MVAAIGMGGHLAQEFSHSQTYARMGKGKQLLEPFGYEKEDENKYIVIFVLSIPGATERELPQAFCSSPS